MEPESLHTKAWYRPNLSRQEVEQMLFGKSYGAFIVRKSSKKDCLALSHINRNGDVGHAIVYVSWKGYCLENETTWHPTVSTLLTTLSLDYHGDGGINESEELPALPPTPAVDANDNNESTASSSPHAAKRTATTTAPSSSPQTARPLSPRTNTKFPSALEQTIAELNDPGKLKMGLFKLRDALLDAQFAKEFIEAGCLKILYDICRREEGNTLAYGLDSLRVVLKFHHAAEQGAISPDLLILLMAHFESQSSAVSKASMELFLTLNQRDKDLFQQTFIHFAKQRNEEPLANLVRVFKAKEVDIVQKAVTLLNHVLMGATAQEHGDLYRGLARAGLYTYFPMLCKSEDRLTRTQLCAFQIQRLRSIGARKHTAYDKSNPQHEKMLMVLWEVTFPDEKLEGRVSSQWGKLGFQGTDPATDFRGMGMLGLENLVYFAQTYSDQWCALIKRNIKRGKREYPVAVAGINACAAIDQHFGFDKPSKNGEALLLHPLLIEHSKPFEEMHALVLQTIDQLWDEFKASYMDFPQVMDAAKEIFEDAVVHYKSFKQWSDDVAKKKRPPLRPDAKGKKGKRKLQRKKGTFIQSNSQNSDADANKSSVQAEVDVLRGEVAQLRKMSSIQTGSAMSPRAEDDIHLSMLEEVNVLHLQRNESVLAESAHAVVRTATWHEESVCVKEYRSGNGIEALEEFVVEVRALATARHRNVVTIMGVCSVVPTALCIVTELYDTNLCELLHGNNGSSVPSFAIRVRLVCSMARGLAYLHTRTRAIVHGNLSSHNVLVDRRTMEAAISSFGAHNRRLSTKGSPFLPAKQTEKLAKWSEGTVWHADCAYLAPENFARDDAIKAPADVFSAAVVLWEVAHCKRPHHNVSVADLVEKVFVQEERLPLEALHDGQEDYNDLIKEMWHVDVAARPTATQVWKRLAQIQSVLS